MKNMLSILLVLLCGTAFAQNHWIPNTDPYEDYMAMIVVLQIDGVEQTSTTLELGAFCGDECRGSALAAYFPPTNRYLYQLPVYGNHGDTISFRLYDHESQVELDLVTTELVYADEGYGVLASPCLMDFSTSQPQPTGVLIELTPGWNWISYLLETETPTKEALVNLTPCDGDIIKNQNKFSTFRASTGHWEGSLISLTPGKGYMYLRNGEATTFIYPKPQ